MPEAYWEFLNRPLGKHTSVFDASTTLYRDTILSTAAFSALFILTPIVSNIFFPKWYNNMDKKRKFDFKSYFVCLFHHCYVVPVSWYHIYLDYIAPKSQYNLISYAHSEIFFIPFCLGYLLSDTAFYAVPEIFRGKFEYIIHHILTVTLVLSSSICGQHSGVNRYIPHLLISDSANLFFNIAWILRTVPDLKGSKIVFAFEMAFVTLYLLIRCIHMPMMFVAIYLDPAKFASLGIGRFMLFPIGILQWYWMSKIIGGLQGRFKKVKR
jgi:hypothetical protein